MDIWPSRKRPSTGRPCGKPGCRCGRPERRQPHTADLGLCGSKQKRFEQKNHNRRFEKPIPAGLVLHVKGCLCLSQIALGDRARRFLEGALGFARVGTGIDGVSLFRGAKAATGGRFACGPLVRIALGMCVRDRCGRVRGRDGGRLPARAL